MEDSIKSVRRMIKRKNLALSILGLEDNYSPQLIRKSYKELSLKYHPDLHPEDPTAQRNFCNISNAKELLIEGDGGQELFDLECPTKDPDYSHYSKETREKIEFWKWCQRWILDDSSKKPSPPRRSCI